MINTRRKNRKSHKSRKTFKNIKKMVGGGSTMSNVNINLAGTPNLISCIICKNTMYESIPITVGRSKLSMATQVSEGLFNDTSLIDHPLQMYRCNQCNYCQFVYTPSEMWGSQNNHAIKEIKTPTSSYLGASTRFPTLLNSQQQPPMQQQQQQQQQQQEQQPMQQLQQQQHLQQQPQMQLQQSPQMQQPNNKFIFKNPQ